MPRRLMFLQLKTGHQLDRGPAWIAWVDFTKSRRTARVHGRELARFGGFDSNFYDLATGEEFWLSGPKRDRTDARYSSVQPSVDADAAEAYADFLAGGPPPGRESG